jgi:DNA polymerase elongation subunit (family B)
MTSLQLFQPKCKHRHTIKTHPSCFNSDGTLKSEEEVKDHKVLIFDVETLPLVAYAWKVWDENISDSQIIKDWCILSWSAKWLHDDKIMSDVLNKREALTRNDRRIITSFWKLLEDADVVIAHNGKRFDIKKVNTRMWKHQLPKPSSYKVIDTLASVKSVFSLNHNGQNAVAKFLEIQEKLDTDFDLWIACDRGDSEALKYMSEYNDQDVRMLEEIYLSMREWIPNHPDLRIYKGVIEGCPVCLSSRSESAGYYTAKSNRYPEHRCLDCGTVWHDSQAEKKEK